MSAGPGAAAPVSAAWPAAVVLGSPTLAPPPSVVLASPMPALPSPVRLQALGPGHSGVSFAEAHSAALRQLQGGVYAMCLRTMLHRGSGRSELLAGWRRSQILETCQCIMLAGVDQPAASRSGAQTAGGSSAAAATAVAATAADTGAAAGPAAVQVEEDMEPVPQDLPLSVAGIWEEFDKGDEGYPAIRYALLLRSGRFFSKRQMCK